MKYFFLVLLFPFQLVAQKPIRHYDFASRKQTGLFVGAFSISPKGNMLLATFNDLDKKVVYELVNTSTGKLIGTGPLPAKPLTIAWTDDEKMVAISYSTNAVCYDVNAGMKKIFSTRMDGDAVFSRNSSLLVKNFSPDLYVFGDERVYRYDSKGVLMDSTRTNMFPYYTGIWFDLLHDCFVMAEDEAAKLSAFSVKDKKLQLIAGTLSNGNASHIAADKDGSKFFYYDENDIYVHDAGNAKKITNYRFNKIASACFTPDSKNILVLDDKQVSLLDMQGKVTRTMNRPTYYSHIGYASFGLELIAAHPDGFDVYACKDYFFVKEGPVVTKPPVDIPPVKIPSTPTKTEPATKQKPWSLTYTILYFITPFDRDSFYLYSSDKALRFYIKYEKGISGILSPVGFHYSQFFGLSKDVKYQLLSIYILDMTDSTAGMGTYARSGLVEKPTMVGGQNFLGKISSSPGKVLSWPMKLFDEEYTLSAKLIDNVYKGKKAKCLTVTRDDPKNKVNETYYYQQGVGLIKIESNGKVGFER